MSNQRKKSVEAALNKFLEKDWHEQKKLNGLVAKRKHSQPEKEVEKECLIYIRSVGAEVEIYESKATLKDGVWRQQGMKSGVCDCQGILPDGCALAIEFKAPGKRSNFNSEKRHKQKAFLLSRLNMGAFACVVDSAKMLQEIYENWNRIRAISPQEAKHYLLSMLP